MIACLGGEGRVVELLEDESGEHLRKSLLDGLDENHRTGKRSFCNFFWHPCKLGKDVLTIEKFGLVQYFYNVTHERLQPIKPLAKFISFKAIVFATWWQGMAIAAVAHVFVFSAKPYHFIPASTYGKVTKETTEAALEIDEGDKQKPAMLKETKTQVEAPRTSVTESVQDIVVEGGQRVVKDVVLTINQAMGPVEKGVTRIQQTFHHKTVVSSDDEEEESDIEVDYDVTENVTVKGNEIATM
ncbi:Organic solute transporter subunit alpha/Transmembrane protein [Sesbania bispinosa]|nr:Organic solute transporter subunit alpha/Transmembrane protein [Sesbania bispinosa]